MVILENDQFSALQRLHPLDRLQVRFMDSRTSDDVVLKYILEFLDVLGIEQAIQD